MEKEEIRKRLAEAIKLIPKNHLSDPVIKETIRCVLYQFLKEQGFQPIPAFRDTRYPEGPADIVGMIDGQTLKVGFCSSSTIRLEDVKSLARIPCEQKFIISFSDDQKKVKMSTFYLKPGIEHINIHETEK